MHLEPLDSPLGPLMAATTPGGVCLLEFSEPGRLETQLAAVRRRFNEPLDSGPNEHLHRLRAELAEYFAGAHTQFTVPLMYPGTAFERQVWEELLRIPYGETRSYEDMARRVGRPGASRAVGTANGRNRIAIVIPCHRVINKNGRLGGYGGGLWRKRFLLDLERPVGQACLLAEAAP